MLEKGVAGMTDSKLFRRSMALLLAILLCLGAGTNSLAFAGEPSAGGDIRNSTTDGNSAGTIIDEDSIPTNHIDHQKPWSIANLVMTVLTVLIALSLSVRTIYLRTKSSKYCVRNDHLAYAIIGLVLALGSIVFFVAVENMHHKMQEFDTWTPLFLAALVAVLILVLATFISKNCSFDDDGTDWLA
jgi:hypothetical protein